MTAVVPPTQLPDQNSAGRPIRVSRRRGNPAATVMARGEPMVWLTGGALAFSILMILGLLLLIFFQGTKTFWPVPVMRAELMDGTYRQGEVIDEESFMITKGSLKTYAAETRKSGLKFLGDRESAEADRIMLRSGNFELTNTHYEWIYSFDIQPEKTSYPEWALTIERLEWGRFFGEPMQFIIKQTRQIPQAEQDLKNILAFFELHVGRVPEDQQQAVEAALAEVQAEYEGVRLKNSKAFLTEHQPAEGMSIFVPNEAGEAVTLGEADASVAVDELWHILSDPAQAYATLNAHHQEILDRNAKIKSLERHKLGEINARIEQGRLSLRQIEIDHEVSLIAPADEADAARMEWSALEEEIAGYRGEQGQWATRLGKTSPLVAVSEKIIGELTAEIEEGKTGWQDSRNQLSDQVSRLSPESHETLLSLFELQESATFETQRILTQVDDLKSENARYQMRMKAAQGGDVTLAVSEIVRAYPANQLTFGDRFSIYFSRWYEFLFDDPRESNSEGGVFPAIWGTLIMTVLMSLAVVPFGVLSALYLREYAKKGIIVSAVRISINNLAGVPSIVFGVFGLGFFCYIIGASIDEMLYSANLPNPTFGKGGLVWASFTLALLTLPVVIVATEEALSAVPNSMREGSFACGAGKWQTIRRIVLPRALPGIMTGAILAMARGAGEVAPLMLVGAVKLAPELPFDLVYPFVHGERSFMHLGFHIYDLGFQSQNSEAAKPMVFTTTLLLIAMITLLNVSAIWLRGRLRRKFHVSQF
ncbi:MAG: phosphate ABC transporter permease PstA [Planctomycetaceae bacterium]